MEQYIIVKVRDSQVEWPPYPYRGEDGKYHTPSSNLGKVRKAIHKVSKDEHISLADMVTHTMFMTQAESDKVKEIFETAMSRGKREHERRKRFYGK